MVNIDEERIREKIEQRSNFEKSKLFARRTTTFIINCVLLLMGWTGIIMISIYDKKIQAAVSGIKGLNQVASLIPSISLSVINAIVPILSKKLTEYEAWDF
jgi:hypothetical protein